MTPANAIANIVTTGITYPGYSKKPHLIPQEYAFLMEDEKEHPYRARKR